MLNDKKLTATAKRRKASREATAPRDATLIAVLPQLRRLEVLAQLVRSSKRFDFTRITPPEDLIREDRER